MMRFGLMVDFERVWSQVKDKPGVNGINEEISGDGKIQVTVSRVTPQIESEIPKSLDGGDGNHYDVEIIEVGEIRAFKKN